MTARHEFETTEGDELTTYDMLNATWIVVQTFVDINNEPPYEPVFTHRVELHRHDDMVLEDLRQRGITKEVIEERMRGIEPEKG